MMLCTITRYVSQHTNTKTLSGDMHVRSKLQPLVNTIKNSVSCVTHAVTPCAMLRTHAEISSSGSSYRAACAVLQRRSGAAASRQAVSWAAAGRICMTSATEVTLARSFSVFCRMVLTLPLS